MDSLNVDLTIKPQVDGDAVTIHNKLGGNFKIPVSRSLTIESITIDSLDSIVPPITQTMFEDNFGSDWSLAYDSCWSDRYSSCCTMDENGGDDFILDCGSIDTTDVVLTENCVISHGSSMIYFMTTYKSDLALESPQSLTLTDVTFKNTYHDINAIVAIGEYSADITVTNLNVWGFTNCGSVFRNHYEDAEIMHTDSTIPNYIYTFPEVAVWGYAHFYDQSQNYAKNQV
jgi:hypothetical protein